MKKPPGRKYFTVLLFQALAILLACTEGPKNEYGSVDQSLVINKTQEEITGRKYLVDSSGSFINWMASNTQARHYGIFPIDHGYLTVKDSAVVGGEIYIRLSGINILDLHDNPDDNARLSELMKSKYLLDAADQPIAKFVIDSINPVNLPIEHRQRLLNDISKSYPNDSVYGRLTLKGITRQLIFPARIDIVYFKIQSAANFMIGSNGWDLHLPPGTAQPASAYSLPDSINIGFDIIAVAQ